MSSDAQIKANQSNAQHSTGPKTPEGKLASSENATKHGVYSQKQLVPGEDPAQLDALRKEYLDDYKPAGPTQNRLVEDMIDADWKVRRFTRLEDATYRMYALALADQLAELPDDADFHLAYILHHDSINAKMLKYLTQQQARMNRLYNRSSNELRKLQAAAASEALKPDAITSAPVVVAANVPAASVPAPLAARAEQSQTPAPIAEMVAEIRPAGQTFPAKAA